MSRLENHSAKDPEVIRKMFGSIAKAYDPANTVLSFGIHKRWKKTLVRKSGAKKGSRILDCATGTGDLAFEFNRQLGGDCAITATDFCPEMLDVARKKTNPGTIHFEIADAMNLQYENSSFDVASISFGIRNTPDPKKALSEMARVVKPGGTVMVLEFGVPHAPLMKTAFGWYSKQILPRIGGWISGQPEAYRYLERSSSEFPSGEKFLAMAREAAPFSKLQFQSFQGGIAYLYELKV